MKQTLVRVEVLSPFELPAGVLRQVGERMSMTLQTAEGYGEKVRWIRTAEVSDERTEPGRAGWKLEPFP